MKTQKQMRHILVILLFLISNQVFTQSLSEKLEDAYMHDSQRALRRALKELSINNLDKPYIPDSIKDYYEVYNSIISQNKRIWPDWINLGIQIPLIKYKVSFVQIQNQLIYGRTDSTSIELFLDTKHIEFDTIKNFTPYANYKKPQLLQLNDRIQREFEIFINLENKDLNELLNETEKQINKSIKNGSLIQSGNDSFTIPVIDKKVNREDFIRQISSHKRIDFLRKQINISVGNVNQGRWDWKIKPQPEIKYMIMDYNCSKIWVLESFCLIETIWIKKDKKWIVKEYMNIGCL